jgi:hypothetical protein
MEAARVTEAEATLEAPGLEPAELEPALPPEAGAAASEAGVEKTVSKPAKEKKGKGKGKEKPALEASGDAPTVAAHPRAARSVATAKGWGGLGGFVLGGYLSLPTHTLAAAGLRAILAGIVCYVAAWAGAVFFWRRMVVLEIKAREQQLLAAARGAPGAPGGRPGESAGARS